jgi:hypothetical protein
VAIDTSATCGPSAHRQCQRVFAVGDVPKRCQNAIPPLPGDVEGEGLGAAGGVGWGGGGKVAGASVAGGEVAGGAVALGAVAGGAVAGASVPGGAVAGAAVVGGAVVGAAIVAAVTVDHFPHLFFMFPWT